VINHNPHRARLFRELQRLGLPRALILHANVRQLPKISCALAVFVGYVADEHAEARLEGSHFAGLGSVEECVGHVVYHLRLCEWVEGGVGRGLDTNHAAVCLFDALLRALRDAFVRSITGFEVDYCGPVVTCAHTSVKSP
jgi:hypothetical protein